jgi:hypothetical protein
MAVLKTRTHNERAEIEFELDYLASLTTQQRFEMRLRKSREMAALRKRHGRRRTTQIIKRTVDLKPIHKIRQRKAKRQA